MPKRLRRAGVIRPARVVAPIRVKGSSCRLKCRALGPLSMISSTRQSSMAG